MLQRVRDAVFSAAVTTVATRSPKMSSDELQNRYSSPTWERNTSMQKWRPFWWHHVTTPHHTFSVVPKGFQVQCSKQATHTHPIETPPSITGGVWIEKSWRSRSHQPDSLGCTKPLLKIGMLINDTGSNDWRFPLNAERAYWSLNTICDRGTDQCTRFWAQFRCSNEHNFVLSEGCITWFGTFVAH